MFKMYSGSTKYFGVAVSSNPAVATLTPLADWHSNTGILIWLEIVILRAIGFAY